MDQLNTIFYFIFLLISIGGSKNGGINDNSNPITFEETIDISNYKKVVFGGNELKIGTPRKYYIKGELVKICIKNLPTDIDFRIKFNGRKIETFLDNGDWFTEIKAISSGIKKHSIQIVDLNSQEEKNLYIEIDIRDLNPFVESEFGQFLIKEIPTNLWISNLAVTCTQVRINAEGAMVLRTSRGYQVTPCKESDKVIITMIYFGRTFKKVFRTIEVPPPHMTFINVAGLKCIELEPIGLFKDLNYSIQQINGHSFPDGKEMQIKNSHCYRKEGNFMVREIIYAIDDTDFVDTLKLN